MSDIEAPNGSKWENVENRQDLVVWTNTGNGDSVEIEKLGETEEPIPESQWVGTGGQDTRITEDVEARYPDEEFEVDDFKKAVEKAKEWMGKYPNKDEEYGEL